MIDQDACNSGVTVGKGASTIALFLDHLTQGGVQRVTLVLAKELSARGYTVDLVVCKAEGAFLSHVPSNVNLVTLPGVGRIARVWHGLLASMQTPSLIPGLMAQKGSVLRRWLRFYPGLRKYLESRQPAALLVPKDKLSIMAAWAKRQSNWNGRLVIAQHVHFTACRGRTIRSDRWHYFRSCMRKLYVEADAIFAVSRDAAKDLSAQIGLPVSVIYNPMSLPVTLPETVDDPWGHLIDKSKLIISAGTLDSRKDHATLLRAFAKLAEKRSNVKLAILGEGPERKSLETLIAQLQLEDKVRLLGHVDNVYSWMVAANLFVLSSVVEGFGLVIIEALACGCPVVSTNCPSGPSEILEDGEYGVLVPVGDHDQLAVAMDKVLDCPPEAAELKAHVSQFSVKESIDRYVDVLLDD